MGLRERIARAVIPRLYWTYSEWDESDDATKYEALEIAGDVIDALGLAREEERVGPRAGSTTKFAPHTVERYVTPWERADDA